MALTLKVIIEVVQIHQLLIITPLKEIPTHTQDNKVIDKMNTQRHQPTEINTTTVITDRIATIVMGIDAS